LTRVKSWSETTSDGTTVLNGIPSSSAVPEGIPAGKRRKATKRKQSGGPAPKAAAKSPAPPRNKGSEICNNFTRGTCSDPCPYGRIHPSKPAAGTDGKPKGKSGGKGSAGGAK